MRNLSKLAATTAVLLLALAACESGTGGRLVEIAGAIRPLSEPGAALGVFTTDTGWSVVLVEAKIAIDGLFVFEPDPAEQAALAALFGPPRARAHGGVDPLASRTVRAEWTEPQVVDVLSSTGIDLGLVLAEAGSVDELELRLAPPPPELASGTRGHVAFVRGTATRGGTTLEFEGGVDVADVGTQRRIESIPIEASLDDGSTLSLAIRPSVWFRGAELDRLAAPDPATGITALASGSQPGRALFLGIRNPAAYEASLDSEGGMR